MNVSIDMLDKPRYEEALLPTCVPYRRSEQACGLVLIMQWEKDPHQNKVNKTLISPPPIHDFPSRDPL